MEEYKSRKEVPENYKWDLTNFFTDDKDWKNKFNSIKNKIHELGNYKNKLNDANMLEEYLEKYFLVSASMMNLYVYSYLKHDVELENPIYIEMKEKISSLYTEYNRIIAFFEPELLSLDEQTFENLFKTNPNLNKFKILLEEIYEQKIHILSETEEKLISMLTDTYNSYVNISSSLINSEHDYGKITNDDGKKIQIASNNVRKLKQSENPKIRKDAYNKFGKTLKRYETTESALLNNYVKNNTTLSKIRNYDSTFDEVIKNNHLTKKVYDALQTSCNNHLVVNQKFYKLMKKVLNFETLHSYDTSMIWNKSNKTYSIEEANEITLKSLNVLGEEYNLKLNKVFDNHYIDYCQYKGKYGGGYSYSTYDKDSRILMNYKGTFDCISTIAHEAGHNVHHQFVNDSNPLWYRHTPTIVAEVASLTNEFLLANYMINNGSSKNEKLIGLESVLKVYQSNFYGAIMEGELELLMYDKIMNGETITADFLNNNMGNLLKKYRGNIIKSDKYSNLTWVTRSHYYEKFYLFSYAISVSVAIVLASKIINKEDGILEKYYKFLKAGSDLKPIEIYKILDIDIEDINVYEQGISYFDKQLDLYDQILNNK